MDHCPRRVPRIRILNFANQHACALGTDRPSQQVGTAERGLDDGAAGFCCGGRHAYTFFRASSRHNRAADARA